MTAQPVDPVQWSDTLKMRLQPAVHWCKGET